MATKMNKGSAMRQTRLNKSGSVSISPDAVQAWVRIPQQHKTEIIEAVERPSASPRDTQSVKVGSKVLTVRRMPSGFRVVYEPHDGRYTIISVLTPREAGLVEG